jgi:hypothetical protein
MTHRERIKKVISSLSKPILAKLTKKPVAINVIGVLTEARPAIRIGSNFMLLRLAKKRAPSQNAGVSIRSQKLPESGRGSRYLVEMQSRDQIITDIKVNYIIFLQTGNIKYLVKKTFLPAVIILVNRKSQNFVNYGNVALALTYSDNIVIDPTPQVNDDTYQLWIDLINDLKTQENREGPFSWVYRKLLRSCVRFQLERINEE